MCTPCVVLYSDLHKIGETPLQLQPIIKTCKSETSNISLAYWLNICCENVDIFFLTSWHIGKHECMLLYYIIKLHTFIWNAEAIRFLLQAYTYNHIQQDRIMSLRGFLWWIYSHLHIISCSCLTSPHGPLGKYSAERMKLQRNNTSYSCQSCQLHGREAGKGNEAK